MMKGKLIFQMYTEWAEIFNLLEDEKAGQLIKHIFAYVNDEEPQTEELLIKLSFAPIKAQLKRDLKKWKKRAERSRENGQLGGRPPKPRGTQNNQVGLKETQKNQLGLKKPVEVEAEAEVEAEVITDKDILLKKDFEKFLNLAFKYLGKQYISGAPQTSRIESQIRRWLVDQNPEEQCKNILAYQKLTDKKFRAKAVESLLTKLEEYYYPNDLVQTASASTTPTRSKEEQAKIDQETRQIREAYKKQIEEAQKKLTQAK